MLLQKIAPMFLLAATACTGVVVVEPIPEVPPERRGDLTMTWTIAGRAEAASCDFYAAAELQIDLYDGGGGLIASEFPSCKDIAITFDLPEGSYDAAVTLLDPAGRRVSTTLELFDLTVIQGTEIVSDIDFPRDSIF